MANKSWNCFGIRYVNLFMLCYSMSIATWMVKLRGQFSLDGGSVYKMAEVGRQRHAWASTSSPMALNLARSRWLLPALHTKQPSRLE